MPNTPPTPAQISYTDGNQKTIVFPEVNRGDLKNLSVDGEQIMQIHDIAKKTEHLSRQIRFIGALAGTIAVAVLVVTIGSLSLIYQYENNHQGSIERIARSKVTVASRLYMLTGNIWTPKGWIVDPGWQQDGNRGSGVSVNGIE